MRGCLFAFFTFLIPYLYGQLSANGKLTGKIVDSFSQKPVEYATVTLLNKSAKPISGAISDSKGVFTISNIPQGRFTIIVDFIGYQRFYLPPLRP